MEALRRISGLFALHPGPVVGAGLVPMGFTPRLVIQLDRIFVLILVLCLVCPTRSDGLRGVVLGIGFVNARASHRAGCLDRISHYYMPEKLIWRLGCPANFRGP